MHEKISEVLSTPVVNTYDVAVCGGGFGGISAALAAARMGKKTVLFEREFILGGLGTAGLITIYLPLCDGLGHQVSFGIAEELLRLSISMGAEARYPANWLDGIGTRTENDLRFAVRYNAQLFAILAEQLLLKEGVEILYGTQILDVTMDGDKISHLVYQNKSGRQACKVTSVVDATGDCDIGLFAGAPTETFQQGNILASWYYYVGQDGYNLKQLGCADVPKEEQTETNKQQLLMDRRFTGLDGKELSEMTVFSHASVLNHLKTARKDDPSIWPVTIATIPQIRMTRKIVGEYTLSQTEDKVYFEDSIGMVSNWKKRGPIYEVPFRTLYSKQVKNLITAGRCTCVTETLWDVMRVIPCCAVTGQAAGTAAAMTDDFSSLSVEKLQKQLVKDGVVLHVSDIL